MKESKLLKSIAYLLIFILPILIIGNILYMLTLASDEEVLNAESIYETEYLKITYLSNLQEFCDNMEAFAKVENLENGFEKYTVYKWNNQIVDTIILDLENQRIFTNMALENEMYQKDTLDKLFENDKEKYLIYQDGTFISNIEVLKDINNSFWELKENMPYADETEDKLENIEEIKDINNSSWELKENMPYADETEDKLENIEEIEDISKIIIYSKISEEKNLNFYLKSMYLDITKVLGRTPAILTPIFFLLFLACFIYVISAAGHKKGHEGIYLSYLDQIIPFDVSTVIVFGLLLMLYAIFHATLHEIIYGTSQTLTGFYTLTMATIMILIVAYLVIISWFITAVRRIKAKTFLKNNLTVICIKKILKILYWFIKKIVGIFCGIGRRIKMFWQNLYRYIGLNIRVLLALFSFALLTTFFCILMLDAEGFVILLLLLWGIVTYFTVKKIARFKEIKSALKSIYEGDTNFILEEEKFPGELREMSHYINDISGGFSNAITQGIQSERMKAELITNVSHDIKTPLTSIINYVDLLKKEEIPNEKAKEYIAILDAKSQRLKRLTEDLVEASKASSGNLTLEITKINLEELLSQSIGEFQEKGLEIIYHVKKEKINKIDRLEQGVKANKLDNMDTLSKITNINKAENLIIKADSRYMYRIIENLFSNIQKYALEYSRVYIDLESKENQAFVTLKNISKEKLNISEEELMQRFVRGDKSRTTEGSGLGLSIAKSLTELQKGTFSLSIDGDLFKVVLKFNLI